MDIFERTIQPIILCGGSGSRLWPISTVDTPKQFLSLGKKGTLLEETLRRVGLIMDSCKKKHYKTNEPMLVMHKTHNLPPELSLYNSNIVYEDYANDTAVAIARALLEFKNKYPKDDDTIALVLPADHYIYNVDAFIKDIIDGIDNLTSNNIVLYGIDPTAPESKYGYIIPSEKRVKFKEKPDANLALELINKGALWNSGIFTARVDLIVKCIRESSYNIIDWVNNPKEGKAPSFDVAILQEYEYIYAHHCSGWRWSDIGTWESFINIPEIKLEMKDLSDVIIEDCSNTKVLKRSTGNMIIIGCKDLLVVSSNSDILIMSNTGDYNNKIKDIVSCFNK